MGVPFKKTDVDRGNRVSVATGLKAVQPIFHIARAPAYLARANMAGARETAISRPAIQSRARFEAGNVEDVGDGQELLPVGGHGCRPFIRGNAGRVFGRR